MVSVTTNLADVPVATTAVVSETQSHFDWSAVLAGAVVSAGITSVFATFGLAVGLATISPYTGDGSGFAVLLALTLWAMWTTVSSVMVGGYIAGRMRRRVVGISSDELSVRDGIHGLAVWGAAILMGAWLLGAGAGAAVDAAAQTSPTVVAAVTDAVTPQPGADVTQPADATAVIPAPTKEELETARRYSVISAFVVAASLMIAAAGAYWAAGVGGRHRDENRVFARFGTWL